MHNYGMFNILGVRFDRCGQQPIAVSARCNACGHVTATWGPELKRSSSGTILTCASCLLQQTVNNSVLKECYYVPTEPSPNRSQWEAQPEQLSRDSVLKFDAIQPSA